MKIIAILLSLFYVVSAFADEDPGIKPEHDALADAVISSNWSWEQVAGGPKSYEEIQFYLGGSAQNFSINKDLPKAQGWTAHWEVAAPRMLVIENTKPGANHFGHKAYLVFDAAFTHFVGFDYNGKTTVEGFRREAVDPKRQPPAANNQ